MIDGCGVWRNAGHCNWSRFYTDMYKQPGFGQLLTTFPLDIKPTISAQYTGSSLKVKVWNLSLRVKII